MTYFRFQGQKRDEYGAWSAMFQEDNCPYDQDCTSNIQCECEDYHLECRMIGSLNRRCIEVVDKAWERSGKPLEGERPKEQYKPEIDKPFQSIIQVPYELPKEQYKPETDKPFESIIQVLIYLLTLQSYKKL